jgi:OHCU decarboxylase
MDLSWLNQLGPSESSDEFVKCCGSLEWARRMTGSRPFTSLEQLQKRASEIWWTLDRDDWLEAFRSHPKIGGSKSAEKVSNQSRAWSGEEQSGVKSATEQVLSELATLNRQYDDKFGFIFIVCASGKSSDEMLAILKSRLAHDAETELRNAASEQEKITEIRLRKLILPGS